MNTDLKNTLQKLVNKLEMIKKDSYVVGNKDRSYICGLWEKEFQEAKRVLEKNNKPPENLCLGIKNVDLFDVQQLGLPLKDETEF